VYSGRLSGSFDGRFGLGSKFREPLVGEAERLQLPQPIGVGRQAGGGDGALCVHDAREFA
jgi:hypothetical protein